MVKNLLPMQEIQEMQVNWVGLGRSHRVGDGTHSSILALKMPRAKERGGLQSTGHKELVVTERS